MKLSRHSSGRPLVGLDIEPGAVTAVVGDGSGRTVLRSASHALPSGIVREGEVADVAGLAAVLSEMFERSRLDRRVRLGVANQRIVMRTLDLPQMEKAKEIDSAIRFQAAEQIPMPLDEAILEHRVLGTVETADGPRTRAVLVAARRDMLENLLEAVTAAGLRVEGIDLSAFAMIRALHDPARSGGVLYACVSGITNLAVADGLTCVFTRSVMQGTDAMAEELAARCGIDLDEAQRGLRRGGLTEPLDEHAPDSALVLDARATLMAGVARIADEIRNTLTFQSMQQPGLQVERAVLTGSAVGIQGFADALAAEIGIPAEAGLVAEGALCAFGGVQPAGLTVASGLTVAEVAA